MPTLAETLVGFALRSYATGLPETIFRQGQRAFPEIDCKFLDQVCLRMPKARAESLLEETWRVHEAADAGSFARHLLTV
jgi:hypothetical protein